MKNIPGPTSRHLLLCLKERLEKLCHDYVFPSKISGRDCRVFLHGLPTGQDDACYPFIVIRWLNGEFTSGDNQTTSVRDSIGFALGIYAPDNQEQAGLLLAELLDLVRRALWEWRIIGDFFQLDGPVQARIPADSLKLNIYHMAEIEAEYQYVQPGQGITDFVKNNFYLGEKA